MALLFVFFAAILASTVNYCLRKNLEYQKSARGYLTLYFIASFAISFLFYSDLKLESFTWAIPSIGAVAGMLNFTMMFVLAKALKVGPSGLTFAFQNAGSMFPAIFLFFLFGSPFGFVITWQVLVGFFILGIGLFLSARTQQQAKAQQLHSYAFSTWLTYAGIIFFIQGLILSIFQWRCLLLEHPACSHVLIPWNFSTAQDSWFMSGFFFIPALFQTAIFAIKEKRWFSSTELFLGIISGLLNGGATFFLLSATKHADGNIKAIMFPFFAVSVIFICSLWGRKLYQERVNWLGMALCIGGVLLGSL